MLGIEEIATYLPQKKVSNYDKKDKFNLTDEFIEDKLGIKSHTLKEDNESSSDLCVKAFENLLKKKNLDINEIECCIVVTQNPDYNIPHTSAIVHSKLNLNEDCACFDISLGCSGFVYSLANIISFMSMHGFKKGLLFTSDQYSQIIDKSDKNTDVIFGDASAVTLITENPIWLLKDTLFGTKGKLYEELICKESLYMNGRAIFNFAAQNVPKHIKKLLDKNNLTDDDIDKYLLHQGSKFIVDTISKRLKIDKNKVPFDIYDYGNTISSSIPILLENLIKEDGPKRYLISGFGVGLSWASAILEKVK